MEPLNLNTLVSVTLGAQFALFQLRIKRETDVGDAGRRTWFPIPDIINILSMLNVMMFCVVLPLAHDRKFDKTSIVVFTICAVLLAFHPICMIGHYRLFTEHGRWIYTRGDKDADFPYYTGAELFLVALAITCAAAAGAYVMRSI